MSVLQRFFFSISSLAQVTATPETRNILRHHAPDRKQLFLNLRFQTEDAQFFRQPKQYYEEILEKDPSTFEQMMKIPFILSKGWLNCKPLLFLARVPWRRLPWRHGFIQLKNIHEILLLILDASCVSPFSFFSFSQVARFQMLKKKKKKCLKLWKNRHCW